MSTRKIVAWTFSILFFTAALGTWLVVCLEIFASPDTSRVPTLLLIYGTVFVVWPLECAFMVYATALGVLYLAGPSGEVVRSQAAHTDGRSLDGDTGRISGGPQRKPVFLDELSRRSYAVEFASLPPAA